MKTPLNPNRFLHPQDSLDGEAIVPGFSMSVAELFAEWDFKARSPLTEFLLRSLAEETRNDVAIAELLNADLKSF